MKRLTKTQMGVFTFLIIFYVSVFVYQIYKIKTTEPIKDLIQVVEKKEGTKRISGKYSSIRGGTWISVVHINKNNNMEYIFVENPFYADSYKIGVVYIENPGTYLNQWRFREFFLFTIFMVFVFVVGYLVKIAEE